jgi:hypothetical protein
MTYIQSPITYLTIICNEHLAASYGESFVMPDLTRALACPSGYPASSLAFWMLLAQVKTPAPVAP